MSCYSTPCNTKNLSGCGVELCSTTKLSTNSVIYTGPTLACSGISSCDTLTDALQKLDFRLCNMPAFTFTASNGITKNSNNFELGGPLTQQTVITTTAVNSLVIPGLVTELSPAFLVSQDTSGVMKKTPLASILGSILANNGITKTGNTIQLGGVLISPTTITTSATNVLKIAGLVINNSPKYIITEGDCGQLIKTTISAILPTPPPTITADNGLAKTGSNIQLSGPLVKPTTVTTNATNTLTLAGLVTDASPAFVITQAAGGQLVKTLASSIIPTPTVITADNGLSKTGNNIQLGGSLIQNTVVDIDSFALTIRDTPSGAGFKIDPAGFAPNTYIKTQVYKPVQFTDAIGINVAPYDNNEKWLHIGKGATFSTVPTVSATEVYMSMDTVGSETGTTVYSSALDRFVWNMNGIQTIREGTVFAAHFSYLQVTSNFSTTATSGNRGSLNASAAQCYFKGSGTTQRVAAFRAFPPVEDAILGFSGTITEAIGIQIDDQQDFIAENITNSYGIKQLGVDDKNLFNAEINIFPNLVDAIDDTAAGLAGVPQWGLYRTGNVVKIKITP